MQPATENKVRSFKSLKDEIRQSIWPDSEPENLLTAHDLMFIEGMGEIQKWVSQEQTVNCSVIRFCKTFHKGGMTVVPCPKGIVTRVYTIAEDNWDHPVFFSPRNWPEPEDWSKRLRGRHLPLMRGHERLPLGFQYAEPWHDLRGGFLAWDSDDNDENTTQDDTPPAGQAHEEHQKRRFERAKHGIYAIHDRNIYMAPWIQSNEMVVIEWYGIKTSSEWTDDDLISDAVDFKKTLKLFLQYAHERDFGDMERADTFHNKDLDGMFDEALADLMWQAREETKLRGNKLPSRHDHFSYLDAMLAGKAVRQLGLTRPSDHHHHHDHNESEDGTIVFAHIGNNGCGTPNADIVSGLVKLWRPRFVIATGGNTVFSPVAAILSATAIAYNEIDLSWVEAKMQFAFTSSLYRSTDPNFTPGPSNRIAAGIPSTQTTYQDLSVAESTTYYYQSVAEDVYGTTIASNIASATTPSNSGGGGEPPLNYPNLRFWYKADDGVFSDLGITPATDGQQVEQWNDSSGNGFNLTQTSSDSRPTFQANQVNSLPSVTFGAAGLSMENLAIGFNQPVTIYLVMKLTNVMNTLVCRFFTNATGSDPDFIHFAYDNEGFAIEAPNLIGYLANASGTFLFTLLANGTSSLMRQGGSQVASGDVGGSALGAFQLLNNALNSTLNMQVLECIGYEAAHDLTTIQAIESYLSSKWGL